MTCRKWLVRGLVFSALGAVALGALTYQAWTNPTAMRALVLAKLVQRFPGATADLESAQLRLLGGIAVSELRLARRNGLGNRDLLYAPSGLIYHDKERVLDGAIAVRKLVLVRPSIRLARERDGSFNWSGVLGPVNLNDRLPTIVIQQGVIVIEDRSAPGGAAGPLLELHDVNATSVNDTDSNSTLTIEGVAQSDAAGPVTLTVRFQRMTNVLNAAVELAAIPVGPPLLKRLERLSPDASKFLTQLTGKGRLRATITANPAAAKPFSYDLEASLSEGSFFHARLPVPLEEIEASVHCVDGMVPAAKMTARVPQAEAVGPDAPVSRIELAVRDLCPRVDAQTALEDLAAEIDFDAEHVALDDRIFDKLPHDGVDVREDFAPYGLCSAHIKMHRDGPGKWHKDWTLLAEGMKARFIKFPYELERVTGRVDLQTRSDHDNKVDVQLIGHAGDRPVNIKGYVRGEKSSAEMAFEIAADDVLIDGKLFDALPKDKQPLARQFMPERSRLVGLNEAPVGRGDVRAHVRRERGGRDFANRYKLTFRDSSIRYDLFPLPLEKVSGVLDILPDHWEIRNVHGFHGGGELRVDARSVPETKPEPPPVSPEAKGRRPAVPPIDPRARVEVVVRGRDLPIDADMLQALAPPESNRAALQTTCRTLGLGGRIGFRADVVDVAGSEGGLDVGVHVDGCTLKPAFFPYAMNEVSGFVRYVNSKITLTGLQARHGGSVLGVGRGLVSLKPGGGYTAELFGVRGDRVLPDHDFFEALAPIPSLRAGLTSLKLRGAFDASTDLKIDAPSEPTAHPDVSWDGGAVLRDNGFQSGVEVTGVTGKFSCIGRHNGQQMSGVKGTLALDKAAILGQPITGIIGHFQMPEDRPDLLKITDIAADLFGGKVGGQAHVRFGPTLHYEIGLREYGVELDKFGRHNLGPNADMSGTVMGGIYLHGDGEDVGGLKGNGRFDVRGKLFRLPLLLDLVKAFGLRLPDRTAFDEAHLVFAVEGPQMRVDSVDLIGNAISLRGKGTVDMDGSNLNLDFNADWARLGQLLPAMASELPRALSDQLFKIKLRGRIGAPRYEKEIVPNIVGPFKQAFGREG